MGCIENCCARGNIMQTYVPEISSYLQYKLVCTNDPVCKEGITDNIYSIAVIKTALLGESESFFMYDISRNREKAQSIAGTMLKFTVTPCAAAEILQELI